MGASRFDMADIDIAWCPGCGNFTILEVLKKVLTNIDVSQQNIVLVSGIGQAAKIPQYLKVHYFNGLHGRALPAATAIKAVNPSLIVIAESGDGDMYGEGGNHFIHCIRRNPNIINIVHNNMVYGLTKGQASPTSQLGFRTPVQVNGVILEPFNPLAVAVALDASFVARTFAGDKNHMQQIFTRALKHTGYSLIDIFQPCVSFNKVNTFQWFKNHVYYLDKSYDPTDRLQAFSKAIEHDPYPLGVIYKHIKPSFEAEISLYIDDQTPLVDRRHDMYQLQKLMNIL